MKKKSLIIALFCVFLLLHVTLRAATQTATVKINSSISYQKITGFGGFVNSPQFGYGHMTTAEIKKVWGKSSDMGLNVMRIYIPIGESSWYQCLATAKLAKSLGITVFASPWSMPAEWKTYNSINAVYTDSSNVQQNISLKEEYYANYANYLNNFVIYLHNNGVELDAISIQNEPDMSAKYAGCIWSPAQIASFLKNYGNLINCKVIAPESVGMTDNYVNALLADDVLSQFEIYGGHQYSYVQSGFKQLQAKGKEAWMTEYLINWNENSSVAARNFSWATDAFTFFNAINTALQANVNAWIHYASKRYYGILGDGQYGTTTGAITKRGYILSQIAKYATGSTRISNSWTDATNQLAGTSFLSLTGDSVIVYIVNPTADTYNLTVDLPFYSVCGKMIKTTETLNMASSDITLTSETCRPKVNLDASSVTTIIFTKSSERQASEMTGTHYNKIDSQVTTSASFGTTYKLSGKTVTFDSSHPLISSNKTPTNGYLKLDNQYNQLVFHVEKVTSPVSYTSSNTTLYYVNSAGNINSRNYGTVNMYQNGNFDWILDISRNVLTDGCTGILGITNANAISILSITFGDVYFRLNTEGMYRFSGIYSKGDSFYLDCIENSLTTVLDFSTTSNVNNSLNWNLSAANQNCIFVIDPTVSNTNTNVITGTSCSTLSLTDTSGSFYAPFNFNAITASLTTTIDKFGVLVLPFESTIPAYTEAYALQATANEVLCNHITEKRIAANTPVLIKGTGTFVFTGTGNVSTPQGLKVNDMSLVYISTKVPIGSFSLKTVDGVPAFYKAVSSSEPTINSFSAYFTPAVTSVLSLLPLKFDDSTGLNEINKDLQKRGDNNIYDFLGQRIYKLSKGQIYIQNGKKMVYNY